MNDIRKEMEVMEEAKRPVWPMYLKATFGQDDAELLARENCDGFVSFVATAYPSILRQFCEDHQDLAEDYLKDRGELVWV